MGIPVDTGFMHLKGKRSVSVKPSNHLQQGQAAGRGPNPQAGSERRSGPGNRTIRGPDNARQGPCPAVTSTVRPPE